MPPLQADAAGQVGSPLGETDITLRRLLAWFDRHRRDLPWRRGSDPYRVWLSEVMLQQTRVETALPYFERFLARFPTVETLAQATVEEVLASWSGLGYYRRARQLHAAANRIAAAGEFPRTVETLLELPGVGAYTAAAVASIAFGAPVPVMDGNVERVTARRLAMAGDPRRGEERARLLAAAAALLDPTRPGDSNQALMELGATVCLPRRPHCLLCPLRTGCRAASEGRQEHYPAPRRRRASESLWLVVAVVAREDRVLLYRRPPSSGLLGGTWELPWLEVARGAVSPSGEEPPVVTPDGLAAKYGGAWTLGSRLGWVRHGITFRDLRVAVHRADWRGGGVVREGAVDSGWFDAAARAGLPMSSLVGKVLRLATSAATGDKRSRGRLAASAATGDKRSRGRLATSAATGDKRSRGRVAERHTAGAPARDCGIRSGAGRGSPASRSRRRRPG